MLQVNESAGQVMLGGNRYYVSFRRVHKLMPPGVEPITLYGEAGAFRFNQTMSASEARGFADLLNAAADEAERQDA